MLPLLLLGGCQGEISKDTDPGRDLDDSGRADTAETGGGAPVVVSVELPFAPGAITTRDTLALPVTATLSDGSSRDVTAEATYASSDEDVLVFYRVGVGQPVEGGPVRWSVAFGDFRLEGDVTVTVVPAGPGDLVLNEVLADGTVDGDPNGDGELDAVDDEFVEIANRSDVTVDLGGVTLVETDFPDRPRHTFPPGTLLRAGEAAVVFGRGSVDTLAEPHVSFWVAANDDPDLAYGLSLRNDGEIVTVVAADGTPITSVGWGDADATNDSVHDASLVRTPDVYGDAWTHHAYAPGSAGDISPGRWVDASLFPGHDARYTR